MIKNNGFKILIFLFFVLFISCEKEKKETTDDIYNTWEVVDFMSIESMLYSKNNNYNPVIEFKNDGSFSLKLDANNCFGSFEITSENNLKIGAAGCTKMCCDSDFSNKFVEMLSRVESYSFEDNQLKLNVPEWGWINLELQ
ncbi:MAG: META domain-containing protein [Bacteroidetes bacterium]|nr:META domain-containing protein [Bacteroidota bacterium]